MSRERLPPIDDDAAPPSRDLASPDRDLAGALHEVSNALTVVLGWLECAREELPPSELARRAVDIALSHAMLGRRLARRAIGDDSDPSPKRPSSRSIVREVVTGVEREALRRGVVVLAQPRLELRAKIVRGAPSLFQVLSNLARSTRSRCRPSGSTVKVETSANIGDARLVVTDSGPGVDPSRRETIFCGWAQREARAGPALAFATRTHSPRAAGVPSRSGPAPAEHGSRSLGPSCRCARPWRAPPRCPTLLSRGSASSCSKTTTRSSGCCRPRSRSAGFGLPRAYPGRAPKRHRSTHLRRRVARPLAHRRGRRRGARQGASRCPSAKVVLISGSAAEVPAAAQG